MIQDIQPRVYDNSYRHETPDTESFIVYVKDNAVLIRETEEGFTLPRVNEISRSSANTYLFSIDEMKFFLAASAAEPEGGFAYRGIMEFRGKEPKFLAFAAATAVHLNNWYKANRFCGRCGAETVHDVKERMLRCDNCGNIIYPRISPAVIVGVTDGDRLLMSRYAGRAYRRYALIAGFSEIGESVEETVKREVLEEVGVRVKNIRYYKSQPWPFSESLLIGFYCDLDGSDEIILDRNELEDAVWIRREDIDVEFDGISLTNEMIVRFKENRDML
jgi:NAD+ diphosphatase